jgi:glutamyl-tRNA(Gln) amidotransferase subunit D
MAEVMILGHGTTNDDFCYALPGTKTRKLHSSRRDAFKAVNSQPFAKIYPDKIIKISDYKIRNKDKAKVDAVFEDRVALLKFYPGQNPDILDYYLKNKYKGIVVEFLGLGQIASKGARESWISKLKEVQGKDMIICAASQTIYGRLDPYVYSSGRELLETGVIYLEDMLSETAFVKLGWVLGHKEWAKSREKVKEKMLENLSHELNSRLEI